MECVIIADSQSSLGNFFSNEWLYEVHAVSLHISRMKMIGVSEINPIRDNSSNNSV
jgi:hypothetical protein